MVLENNDQKAEWILTCVRFIDSARPTELTQQAIGGFATHVGRQLLNVFDDDPTTNNRIRTLLQMVGRPVSEPATQAEIERFREDCERLTSVLKDRASILKPVSVPTRTVYADLGGVVEFSAPAETPTGFTGVSAKGEAAGFEPPPPVMQSVPAKGEAGGFSVQREAPGFTGSGRTDPPLALTEAAPVLRSVEAVGTIVGSSTVTGVGVRLERIEGILQELKPLVEALARGYQQRDGIGGNFPPDPIEAPPLEPEDIIEGIAASQATRSQLDASEPNSSAIHLSTLVLARIGRKVAALLTWFAKKGDTFVEEAVKSAGKSVGLSAGPLVVAMVIGLHTDIGEVVTIITNWAATLH